MSSQQRYRPYHNIDVHSAGSTLLDTTGYLLSRMYRIYLEIKCPLSRRYCIPHYCKCPSAGVPYLSRRNRTHYNSKCPLSRRYRVLYTSQEQIGTGILSAGNTVHITRVLSAGGTVAITEVIVISTVGTVHIASSAYPRSRQYSTYLPIVNNAYPRSRGYHTHHKSNILSTGGTGTVHLTRADVPSAGSTVHITKSSH
jgi:hypothetical protein